MDWGEKWLVDFNAGETQLVLFDQSNNTGSLDVKTDGSVPEEKSYFKMLGLTDFSKLDWGSYIISILKSASKTIGALIHSMKFFSPEVALFTICPCMKYCCHIWAGAPSCYLELLDKLRKQIWRTFGPSLAAFLEPLAYRQNVVDVLQNWLYWFDYLFLEGGLYVILTDYMIFLPPFLDATRMSMSTVSFLTQLDSAIICL